MSTVVVSTGTHARDARNANGQSRSLEESKVHFTATLNGSLLTHLSLWSVGFTAVSMYQPENFITNANQTNDEPNLPIHPLPAVLASDYGERPR